MKTSNMIRLLNETFPGVNAVDAASFDGSEGIWFKGSETADIEGLPMFSMIVHADSFGTHPVLEAFLNDHGWISEAYDSGTLLAYQD